MQKILKYISLFFLLFPIWAKAAIPLPLEQAFVLSAQLINTHDLQLTWQIAPNYHLYHDKFAFTALDPTQLQLAPVVLPPGIPKEDEILGRYQAYQNQVTIPLHFTYTKAGRYTIEVNYQGCADFGFCYPPVTKQLIITLNATPPTVQIKSVTSMAFVPAPPSPISAPEKVNQLLKSHNWLLIITGFLSFGLLLTFTPCVLPLLPILSSIIVGQGAKLTTQRSFYLSLTYALAVAITYALAGVIAALAGSYVQAILQNAWIIILFSLLFVLLAISMFGAYELRLPLRWNERLTALSHRQTGGTYIGVFAMGALSVLIVSPCVTAPLIGVLIYLSATGDVWLGGIALFAMGLGMGIPLILVGTLGGKWLPKAGVWLTVIKTFFGILLLALAIYLLERVIPVPIAHLLWAVLAIGVAVYLLKLKNLPTVWRRTGFIIGIILLLYSGTLLLHFLQSEMRFRQPGIVITPATEKLNFQKIKTSADLQQQLITAKTQHKPVSIDFYADWCVSCHILEREVFQNKDVQNALQNFILLRADVTANDALDKDLQKNWQVIAPPTLIFYDANGQEIKNARIVGEVSAQEFLQHLKEL